MTGPGDYDPFAGFATKDESAFRYSHDGNTTRMAQHRARDGFFRHMPEIANDPGRKVDIILRRSRQRKL